MAFNDSGSCVDAGFSGCCEGDNCEVFPSSNFSFSCFCDVMCFKYGDCCDDISITGCAERNGGSQYVLQFYFEIVFLISRHVGGYCYSLHSTWSHGRGCHTHCS